MSHTQGVRTLDKQRRKEVLLASEAARESESSSEYGELFVANTIEKHYITLQGFAPLATPL